MGRGCVRGLRVIVVLLLVVSRIHERPFPTRRGNPAKLRLGRDERVEKESGASEQSCGRLSKAYCRGTEMEGTGSLGAWWEDRRDRFDL